LLNNKDLKMPGADALTGAGIYYGAAYTEAMNYKDGDVFVVGGANSAAQGAIYLSQFARKVTVLVRAHEPTASKHLVDAMQSNAKIEILTDNDLLEVKGGDKGYIYTGPDLMKDKNPPPNWTLERDPFLLETSTPGIFAAGDVRYGTSHRVASAVGEGAIAYALMKEYLKSL
jgi:thioredoxin reductase (NADPH)